jgi:uncharacterized membrane protein
MADINDKINAINEKLASLINLQTEVNQQITALKKEVVKLNLDGSDLSDIELVPAISKEKEHQTSPATSDNLSQSILQKGVGKLSSINWEKFVGENLINKIGIIILLFGVGIGAKYSIDHNLISPLARIILAYLTGLALLLTGFKIKTNYKNFSAVLVSGALAIFYFVSYIAFDLYALIPLPLAFGLMVIFTIFTVLAALHYNLQSIAHIGLIGAYAVPFLLSNESGNALILFSYIAIINIGILTIALYRKWPSVLKVAFVGTWIIFLSWYLVKYEIDDFNIALGFSFLYFILFYAIFLAHRIKNEAPINKMEIVFYLTNAFLFYGIGFSLFSDNTYGLKEYLGLFTVANALLHYAVAYILYRKHYNRENIFYLSAGMVLIFISMAIPVQFDGNWVTLFWISEAVLLYWIGSKKGIAIFNKLAYPLVLLSFFSLIDDWNNYNPYYHTDEGEKLSPIFNIYFLTSVTVALGLAYVNYLHHKVKYNYFKWSWLNTIVNYSLPFIFLFVCYFSIFSEISYFWEYKYLASSLPLNLNTDGFPSIVENIDLLRFKNIWLINYSLVFALIIMLLNQLYLKNRNINYIALFIGVASIISFCSMGLFELNKLRQSYISQDLAEYYNIGLWNILIRYLAIGLVLVVVYLCFKLIRNHYTDRRIHIAFDIFLNIIIIIILSNEFVNIMDLVDKSNFINSGVTILLGLYALLLVVFGIWKNHKHLRITAIVLFALVLGKLFFVDISHLNAVSKTIVLVLLGLLLLIISFLYNKFKNVTNHDI